MKNKYNIIGYVFLLICGIIAISLWGSQYFSTIVTEKINPLEQRLSELSSQLDKPKMEDSLIINPLQRQETTAVENTQIKEETEIINDSSCEKSLQLIIDGYKLLKAVKVGQFYNELAVLKNKSSDDIFLKEKLNILTKYSDRGTYTLEYLQKNFKLLARQLLQNLKGGPLEETAEETSKIISFLQEIIIVKKTSDVHNIENINNLLNKASIAVMVGNLDEAIKLIKQLPENYIVNINEWTENAERFLVVNSTAENIYEYIMSKY